MDPNRNPAAHPEESVDINIGRTVGESLKQPDLSFLGGHDSNLLSNTVLDRFFISRPRLINTCWSAVELQFKNISRFSSTTRQWGQNCNCGTGDGTGVTQHKLLIISTVSPKSRRPRWRCLYITPVIPQTNLVGSANKIGNSNNTRPKIWNSSNNKLYTYYWCRKRPLNLIVLKKYSKYNCYISVNIGAVEETRKLRNLHGA